MSEKILKTKRLQLYRDQMRKQKLNRKIGTHEKVLLGSPFEKLNFIYVGDEFLNEQIKKKGGYYNNLANELIEYRDWNFEQYCRCLFVERLCSVKGISIIMALDLRDKFTTFDNVSTASEKSLCEIDGIGPGLARKLINQKLPTKDELIAAKSVTKDFDNPPIPFTHFAPEVLVNLKNIPSIALVYNQSNFRFRKLLHIHRKFTQTV